MMPRKATHSVVVCHFIPVKLSDIVRLAMCHTYKELDTVHYMYKRMNSHKINVMVDKNDDIGLKAISQHNIASAMRGLLVVCTPEYGICMTQPQVTSCTCFSWV